MQLDHIVIDESLFKGVKVAIVGDVMLDTFVYGSVDRISPEAPVPVLNVTHETHTLGGASNVAANLSTLGAIPLIIGRIGKDSSANTLADKFNLLNVSMDYLVTASIPTTHKTRIVSQGQQIVRIDQEMTDSIEGTERKQLIENIKKASQETNVVIVADYDKGVLDQEIFDEIKIAWKDGIILTDPKIRTKRIIDYTGSSMMTPNLQESMELLELEKIAHNDSEAVLTAKALIDKFKMDGVLCTRAGDGMTLMHKGKIAHLKPIEKHDVRDVSGAGDTVISVLAAGIAAGIELEDVAELCNIAGGVVVSKTGTATIYWNEIVESMQRSGKYPPFTFR